MKKIMSAAALLAVLAAGCGLEPEASPAQTVTVADSTVAEETTPVAADLTPGQSNAVRQAESYLEYSGFSRAGLIDQLEFEGFTTEDATFAVDAITVDWNEQAAATAAAYLEYSGFSRAGLIDQLEFEGFTTEQAVYGVDQTGPGEVP